MKQLRAKLQSEKGASITYALLLFLVCAVVGSVVLVAATSAAGRLAGLAETDQRYYSATSAAELFRDLYDGKKVTVVREEITETVKAYSYDGRSKESQTGPKINMHMYIDGKEIESGDYLTASFPAYAAYMRVLADPKPAYPVVKDFELIAEGSSGGDDSNLATVNVDGKASLNEDGSLTIRVNSPAGNASSGKDTYSLNIFFGADERTVTDEHVEDSAVQDSSIVGWNYQITTTKTVTKTTVITWQFKNMETVTGSVNTSP